MLFRTKKYDEHDNEIPEPEAAESEAEREAREARQAEVKRQAEERAAAEKAETARLEALRVRFIPKDAEKRTKRAADAVARTAAALAAAQTAADTADAACIEDPSAKALADSRAARQGLADASRDHELSQQHAAKVAGELAAAERAAVADEVGRLEKERGAYGVIDNEFRELAVEVGIICARLDEMMRTREDRRRRAQAPIDELRFRIGMPVSNFDSDSGKVLGDLSRLVLAAQGGRGELLTATIDGRFTQEHADEAAALALRVSERRAKSAPSSTVAAVAVVGLGVLAALGIGHG